jgi:hypothetical protein
MPSVGCTRARCALLAALLCAGAPALALVQGEPGLGDLSRRLREGDLRAVDELLARTKPASIELSDAAARAERLRGEIERLRAAQAARPHALPTRGEEPAPQERGASVDPLREARAWLRAGEPARCLGALDSDQGEAAYLKARALEQLGRDAEALAIYRSLAASAQTPVLKLRAQSDVAHLEWRARLAGDKGVRP